jgi:hypothetical protein
MIDRRVRMRIDARRGAAALTATLALMAGALLGGSGCARHLPIARPYPAPTVAELTEVLRARQRAVASISARARATSWLGGDRVRATVLMLVDRPGRLRFEAEVSLQGTVAVLATDGRQFAFLDTMKNQMQSGPACPANVASLIRIPLGPGEVAAILLGDARLPTSDAAGPTPDTSFVDWDSEQGGDVLAVRRNDGWLRLVFQRRGGDPRDVRVLGAVATGRDLRPRWRVAYEDFADTAPSTTAADGTAAPPGAAASRPLSLPRTIRFAEGEASFDDGVEIKFKERALNEPLTAEAFAITPAPGTRVVEVGCPGSVAP